MYDIFYTEIVFCFFHKFFSIFIIVHAHFIGIKFDSNTNNDLASQK